MNDDAIKARRTRLLELTQLAPFRDRLADQLSGGMKQKLALACTLVHEPQVILLDEPTTGVDPVSRREFWKLLSEFLSQGITILMATPYLDEAERCARVALLHEGRLLALDSPATLRASLKGDVVEDQQMKLKTITPTEFATVHPAKVNSSVAAQIIPPSMISNGTASTGNE